MQTRIIYRAIDDMQTAGRDNHPFWVQYRAWYTLGMWVDGSRHADKHRAEEWIARYNTKDRVV